VAASALGGIITELGHIVAGAFAHPEETGNGEHFPLVLLHMQFVASGRR